MLNESDKLTARFVAGDPVTFSYKNTQFNGRIVRTNPKRAVVKTGDQEFAVPYSLLIADPAVLAAREQRITEILQLALHLIAKHGLNDWTFKFDHSTRRAGCCNYRDQLISISLNLARTASEADIRDTILHEIAHALVGKKHNHDAIWKAKAQEIGCTGERTHKLQIAPPRWNVRCENNCWTQTAERRNARLRCRACGGKLVYSTPSP